MKKDLIVALAILVLSVFSGCESLGEGGGEGDGGPMGAGGPGGGGCGRCQAANIGRAGERNNGNQNNGDEFGVPTPDLAQDPSSSGLDLAGNPSLIGTHDPTIGGQPLLNAGRDRLPASDLTQPILDATGNLPTGQGGAQGDLAPQPTATGTTPDNTGVGARGTAQVTDPAN